MKKLNVGVTYTAHSAETFALFGHVFGAVRVELRGSGDGWASVGVRAQVVKRAPEAGR